MISLRQQELFQDKEPKTALEAIERRLPQRTWIKVSDVATAFDRSVNVVYSWIDSGLIVVFNPGVERGSYSIFRPSVIAFAKKSLGLEK